MAGAWPGHGQGVPSAAPRASSKGPRRVARTRLATPHARRVRLHVQSGPRQSALVRAGRNRALLQRIGDRLAAPARIKVTATDRRALKNSVDPLRQTAARWAGVGRAGRAIELKESRSEIRAPPTPWTPSPPTSSPAARHPCYALDPTLYPSPSYFRLVRLAEAPAPLRRCATPHSLTRPARSAPSPSYPPRCLCFSCRLGAGESYKERLEKSAPSLWLLHSQLDSHIQ